MRAKAWMSRTSAGRMQTWPQGEPVAPQQPQLLGSAALQGVDLQPEEVQARWGEVIEPWGKPPEELLLSPQRAKPLWKLLLASRPVQPLVYLFADQGGGDRRALSTACAFADTCRIPRAWVWQP